VPFVQSLADLIALAIDRARLQTKADEIREASQAERLRSEVMAALSHQLRMPLSAIKGYSTALLMEEVQWSEEKRDEFLRYIDEECDSMQSMITELLDSSLIDVGQLSIEPQPVRLPPIAQDIGIELQRRTDEHQIIIDFPSDFPYWRLTRAGSSRFSAISWTTRSSILPTAAWWSSEERSGKGDVLISIADQGVGISPEDLIPLFEKYFRVNPRDLHVPGTGLGLPVARAIVEAHKGRIWAESKLGQGTILYFSLPYVQMDEDNDRYDKGVLMAKERILIVDDEPKLIYLVREVLSATGFEVLLTCNGEHAIEMVAFEQPDLVLLDIVLPGQMDGYEIARRIRKFSNVPIIMLTAKVRESEMLRGFEAGADDYITKPFSSKELLARIRAVLKRASGGLSSRRVRDHLRSPEDRPGPPAGDRRRARGSSHPDRIQPAARAGNPSK
jgi:CheY-like chemotaxis protein